MLRTFIIRTLRKKMFQPFHERVFHASKIFMNHWGGASFEESGELMALKVAAAALKDVPVPVVSDVGANAGTFTAAVAGIFPRGTRIHAFEPSPVTHGLLKQYVLTLDARERIVCHDFGFGESEGTAVLHSVSEGASVATLWPDRSSTGTPRSIVETVGLRTIDTFCAEQGIDRVDYLKLDVEGHELSILKGASSMIERGRVRFIQFEFGECQMNARQFFRDFNDLLAPRYVLHRIVRDGLRRLPPYTTDQEIFSTANFLAVAKD